MSEQSAPLHEGRRVYELKELCEVLSLSHPTVAKLVKTGRIRSVRVGRRVLIPVTAVDEFLSRGSE